MTTTKQDFEAMQATVKEKSHGQIPSPLVGQFQVSIPRAKAIAVERDRGMNKTEAKYAVHLAALKSAGDIAWFDYESVKLRLADGCLYIPDFMVLSKEGFIELHDVKAWWKSSKKVGIEDDALVKLKAVAEKYPMFKVLATWEKDGRWEQRVF